jgi:hypothetical protein
MISIGLDVHVRNSFMHAVDQDGSLRWRGRCHNSFRELADVLGQFEGEAVQLTKRGPKHLRGVLVEAAWMAVPRVTQYQSMFNRIASRRGKKVAIVAVARRMLEDAWTMLQKDEAFRMTQSDVG